MQTLWQGYGLPSTDNQLWTDVFAQKSFWLILNDTPHVVSRITLPVTTHGVMLWTAEGEIWYTIGTVGMGVIDPGPIPPPAMGTSIPDTAFAPGGVLLSGLSRDIVLPDDGLQHILSLVSPNPSPKVLITAFTEIP